MANRDNVLWYMVNWRTVRFREFEDDEHVREKLHQHRITFEEAVQCFYNPFQVRRNKRFADRFQLIGRTDGGRRLQVIFQRKRGAVVRIITGWDL